MRLFIQHGRDLFRQWSDRQVDPYGILHTKIIVFPAGFIFDPDGDFPQAAAVFRPFRQIDPNSVLFVSAGVDRKYSVQRFSFLTVNLTSYFWCLRHRFFLSFNICMVKTPQAICRTQVCRAAGHHFANRTQVPLLWYLSIVFSRRLRSTRR